MFVYVVVCHCVHIIVYMFVYVLCHCVHVIVYVFDCHCVCVIVYMFVSDWHVILLVVRCGRRLPTQRRSFLVGNLLCRQKNIIDVRTGSVVKTLDDFVCTKRYVTCCITPDQRYILIGEEMVTKLFDFQRGTLLATFPAENLPCVFTVSEDSRQVYVGYVDDCLFKVTFYIRLMNH